MSEAARLGLALWLGLVGPACTRDVDLGSIDEPGDDPALDAAGLDCAGDQPPAACPDAGPPDTGEACDPATEACDCPPEDPECQGDGGGM